MRPRFWHDASSALVADEFDADTLTEASEWGALAAIHVPGNDFAARLRELSRFPAAAIALLGEPLPEDFDPRASAPNLLLGQIIESDDPPPRDPRVHLVFAGADLLVHSTLVRSTGKPIIVIRRLSAPRSLSEARAACDELQRDLAPLGQFAGYIV
jgi:hypothetical protein